MKKYISNPSLGKIDFTKDFIFDFYTIVNENPTLDDTDFVLKFTIEENNNYNSFLISNILDNPYRSKDSIEYTLKNASSDCDYLNDSIIFVNGEPYKNLTFETENEIENYYIKDGITYVKTNKYKIFKNNGTNYIQRINDKNERGKYVRPVKVIQDTNGITEKTFFADKENLFDTNYTRRFRISVSSNCKTITLWDYTSNNLTKIKTFHFTNNIQQGKVKLAIDSNMQLTDLRFSFFEA